jgi:outer membrane protein assembly factor BamE (lipoprotein component of BamABCDE complex)
VQDAISNARVEKGMTKEQVLMSIGYPPTHRTASTQMNNWTYWYNRWVTFVIIFDDQGFVSGYNGSDVPTNNQPVSQVVAPPPRPTPAPHGKKKH